MNAAEIFVAALGNYYKMGLYFIDLLQDDEKEKKKLKLVMWIIFGSVIISNCIENFLYPFYGVLTTFDIWNLTPEQLDNWWVSRRYLNYTR